MASLVVGFAQGIFALDDSTSIYGLAVDASGNWYSGTYGVEVWELSGTSIPASVNLSAAPGAGVRGYDAMIAAGFAKEGTYVGQGTVGPGYFTGTQVFMANVNPAGATVVVALAAWNTSATSWSAMLAEANPGTRAGVAAYVQPTIIPYLNPGVPPVLAMDHDLVMTAIPEPPGFALAGLGAVLMLFERIRAWRCQGRPCGA